MKKPFFMSLVLTGLLVSSSAHATDASSAANAAQPAGSVSASQTQAQATSSTTAQPVSVQASASSTSNNPAAEAVSNAFAPISPSVVPGFTADAPGRARAAAANKATLNPDGTLTTTGLSTIPINNGSAMTGTWTDAKGETGTFRRTIESANGDRVTTTALTNSQGRTSKQGVIVTSTDGIPTRTTTNTTFEGKTTTQTEAVDPTNSGVLASVS